MKILFLSQRFLLPMDTGGKIRTGKLLEQLSRDAEITLVSNVERPKDESYLGEVGRFCERFVEVPWREVPRHSAAFYAKVLGQSVSRYPVSVLNDYSSSLRAAIEREAAQPHDLLVCDFVQSALLCERISHLPRLLFQHNVETEIMRRHRDRARNPLARTFWASQWRKMARFEAECCRGYDQVIAVSERDAEQFRDDFRAPAVASIPTGVDTEQFAPDPAIDEDADSLVFCGSMDWLPNEDAMTFFIEDVLPTIRRSRPGVTLTIVGRNPSPKLQRIVEQREGVELTGWVDDTRPHIARAALFIVPIRIGGGTRMKIYEGMAMHKAVVSTTIGAEGLDYADGRNIRIADGAERFADAVVHLLSDPPGRAAIAEAARRHVCENFSWGKVSEVFHGICAATASRAS